jgi:hypothetical protein
MIKKEFKNLKLGAELYYIDKQRYDVFRASKDYAGFLTIAIENTEIKTNSPIAWLKDLYINELKARLALKKLIYEKFSKPNNLRIKELKCPTKPQ